MAPALTDATSQGRINLSRPTISPPDSHLRAGNGIKNRKDKKIKLDNGHRTESPIIFGPKTLIDISNDPLHHMSDLVGVKSFNVVKTKSPNPPSKEGQDQIHFIDEGLSKLDFQKASSFQQEFLKSISISDRMNPPPPSNGIKPSSAKLENSILLKNDESVLLNGKKNMAPNKINNGHGQEKEPDICQPRSTIKKQTAQQQEIPQNSPQTQHNYAMTINDTSSIAFEMKNPTNGGENSDASKVAREKTLDPIPSASSTDKNKEADETICAIDVETDASKGHVLLEKRLEFYLRRIQRLQGRSIEQHTRKQINSCLQHHRKDLHSLTKSISSSDILNLKSNNEFNINVLNKNLSTAALVNLVQQAQKLAADRDLAENSAKLQETTFLLNIDKRTRVESQKVSNRLLMNTRHAEATGDSDATESSSGGESVDEGEPIPTGTRKIHKRINRQAIWQWCSERATMASRWTWLQAQVSDLEYRIRQQSDIYKQIRQNKGSIVLGDPPPPPVLMKRVSSNGDGNNVSPEASDKQYMASPCNISTLLSNIDKQSVQLNQSLGSLTPRPSPLQSDKSGTSTPASVVNGLIESPYGTSATHLKTNSQTPNDEFTSCSETLTTDNSCQAARCRPLRSYRKRKLLWTINQQLKNSSKVNRLSSVDCHCYPPITPCVMCSGRYNNKRQVDADHRPHHECTSYLDSAFHPVLSFDHDVSLSLKIVSLIRSGNWMTRQKLNNLKKEYKKKKYKKNSLQENRQRIRKNVAAALIQSAKIRNKYENKTKRGHNVVLRRKQMKKGFKLNYKRRQAAKYAMAAMRRQASDEILGDNLTHLFSGLNHSSNSILKELRAESLRKKRGESAYDINNIVIPYSIAAATRVEKLQYKEIATPEWRDISLDNTMEEDDESGTEIEDLSDDSFLVRHQKCEADERKRFASFIQYPMRRRFRNDTGSSGHEASSTDTKPSNLLVHELLETSPSLDAVEDHHVHVYRRDTLSTGSSFDDCKEFDRRETIEPWNPRSFPLSEPEYEEIKAVQPQVYELKPVVNSVCVFDNTNTSDSLSRTNSTPGTSRPSSPFHSSASNSVSGDDPDDPEWIHNNTAVKDVLL